MLLLNKPEELLAVKRDGVEFAGAAAVAFGYSLRGLLYTLVEVLIDIVACFGSESDFVSFTFIYESVLLIPWLPNKEVVLLFVWA